MDMDPILEPLAGDNPSGENLRYTSVYDEIQEARRADDLLDQGEWQHEVKTSDWNAVLTLSIDALTTRTKDLQIAAWLFEALTHTSGFQGVAQGLEILIRLLERFWDSLYPEIEDDDLDYRVGPLEFINDKLWFPIKEIPMTDPGVTPGFSWIKWQESRDVGYEKDTMNQYGDTIEDKKKARDEKIAEGKLTAEDFDGAAASCSRAYYEELFEVVNRCGELFKDFDAAVDERFGREAPRLAELKSSLEDCLTLATRLVKEKRLAEPDAEPEEVEVDLEIQEEALPEEGPADAPLPGGPVQAPPVKPPGGNVGTYHVNRILGSAGIEEAVWQDALKKLGTQGVKPALEQLLGASCSAQSVREKTNFKLLMARLCLKAQRPDLARPIVEELNTLIEELALERWESPIWIAEALGTLYQCLTAEGSSDDDQYRAQDILTRMCTLDVTKAMEFSSRGTE
ncbi:type VI secretion system protein TssA [Desulfospira joergensenii]|uniref:type VI secretion system protein TssA n=1 Tax=Desulfospira joergensenii TaxID=53329 RepID=UPI0003B6E9DC|nr:type VI secretion system protein TssA [Desulfospira joergensenii]